MKALSAPESPRQRTMRRVPKPVMEKRRRERINHSLETLRLLMLENTRDERLKNPKVEKAEILESVVQFLKTGGDMERVLAKEQTRARQSNYRDGMRSCLLRVSRFIATKSQESEESSGEAVQAPHAPPETHSHPSSPGHIQTVIPGPGVGPDPLTRHHLPQHRRYQPYLSQRTALHCETRRLLSSSSSAACTRITDPVWRPWPQ